MCRNLGYHEFNIALIYGRYWFVDYYTCFYDGALYRLPSEYIKFVARKLW